MRIVSWNINSLRKRQDRLFAWLEATEPDIVCLQETKCPDDQFPALALQAAGYHSAYHGEKSYNGVAILDEDRAARGAPVALRRSGRSAGARDCSDRRPACACFRFTRPTDRPSAPRPTNTNCIGIAACEIASRKKNLAILSCAAISTSHRKISTFTMPTCGMVPSWVRMANALLFSELCEIGLRDTLRIHHKEGELFSWWDYQMRAFERNRGLRIDAILASEKLAKKCIASGIDREMRKGKEPSDHAPVWAEFADLVRSDS